MMRSVRFDDEVEAQLEEISQQTGQTISEVLRDAVRKLHSELRKPTIKERLAGIIGSVHSGGGDARRSREEYIQHLIEKHARRKTK